MPEVFSPVCAQFAESHPHHRDGGWHRRTAWSRAASLTTSSTGSQRQRAGRAAHAFRCCFDTVTRRKPSDPGFGVMCPHDRVLMGRIFMLLQCQGPGWLLMAHKSLPIPLLPRLPSARTAAVAARPWCREAAVPVQVSACGRRQADERKLLPGRGQLPRTLTGRAPCSGG
jgi:hypothetical protein